jgi:acyl-CoA reductase-like NAD-dependent aldehyde dehydrogenase
MDQKRINDIVQRVVGRVQRGETAASFTPLSTPPPSGVPTSPSATPFTPPSPAVRAPGPAAGSGGPGGDEGIHETMDGAVVAAQWAHERLADLTIESRERIIAALRKMTLEQAEHFSRMALEETGMGRLETKILKHVLIGTKTPGTEDLRPTAWTGDNGMTLVEYAPFGVLGAITPSTNPTSTVICNGIGMVASGNGVVFNGHPAARRCTEEVIRWFNRTVEEAGGPPSALNTVALPTIKTAQAMMAHPDIPVLVVTGGPAVVKVALSMGKKAICAGDGNPPAVVDETADADQAGRDIVIGAGFDNNVVCVLEKEVIVVDSIADRLIAAMQANGAHLLQPHQFQRLKRVILAKDNGPGQHGVVNKDFVGKDPHVILAEIGVSASPDTKLVIAETPADDSLVWTEQLMPVIPVVRVRNADEGIALAVAAEGGRRHTATMHSKNIDNLSKMARAIKTSIFVKNGPSIAGLGYGGEGFASFSIASPTGEGLTSAKDFSRVRRCTMVDSFRIV